MEDKLFGIELFFGSVFVLIFLGFWANQHQSWRKQTNSAQMVFQGPLAARFFLGGCGLWLILTPPLLMVRDIKDPAGWFLFSFFELMACAMGCLSLAGVGARRELKLDVERCTYQFIIGWGPWTRVHSGRLEDFDGVYISCVSTESSKIYRVGLAWKSGDPVTPTLGSFFGAIKGKRKADALAEEMMNTLGLPLATAPPHETMRDLFRRSSAR